MLKLFRHRGILLQPDFLQNEICASLRHEMLDSDHIDATTVDRDGRFSVDMETRRTKNAMVSAETEAAVRRKLLDAKPAMEQFFAMSLGEPQRLQFLIYREGSFFHAHRDNSNAAETPDTVRNRAVSVVIFLNTQAPAPALEEYSGGSLIFYELFEDPSVGLPVPAQAGMLVAFPSHHVHAVQKVIQNIRYSVVSWYPKAESTMAARSGESA